MKTLRELLIESGTPELQDPARLAQIESHLVVDSGEKRMPWYLQVIQGVGAWLAALFFLGFIGFAIHWGPDSQRVFGVVGVILLVVIVAIGRFVSGVFADQSILAGSLAAQLMILFGFMPNDTGWSEVRIFGYFAVATSVLAAILYFAYPRFLHRFLGCWAALVINRYWLTIIIEPRSYGPSELSLLPMLASQIYSFALLAGVIVFFVFPRVSANLRPIGYACLATYIIPSMPGLRPFWYGLDSISGLPSIDHPFFQPWEYYLLPTLVAALFFYFTIWARNGWDRVRRADPLWMILALGLGGLVVVGAGGIVPALLLLLIGFSVQNRILFAVGAYQMLFHLFIYFEFLPLDLLAKSGTLIASGIALLLLRQIVRRLHSISESGEEIAP